MTSNGLLHRRQGWTAYTSRGSLFAFITLFCLSGTSFAQDPQGVESPPEPQVIQPITDDGAPAIPNAIATGETQAAPTAQSQSIKSLSASPGQGQEANGPGQAIQTLPVTSPSSDEALVESAPSAGIVNVNTKSPATISANQKSQIQPSVQFDTDPGPIAQAGNAGGNNPGNDNPNTGGNPGNDANSAPTGAAELSGFNESPWETSFKDVRKMMKDLSSSPKSDDKVEMLYEQKDKLLTIRRNDVIYIYRFYQPPQKILEFKVSGTGTGGGNNTPGGDTDSHPEYKYGRLFFVTMQLPLLTAKDVRGALSAKYSKPNQPLTDDDGAGVLIWNLNGGFIFQWIEKFDGKLYTRRVDYISAKVRTELADDYKLYFSAKEKKLLKDAKF